MDRQETTSRSLTHSLTRSRMSARHSAARRHLPPALLSRNNHGGWRWSETRWRSAEAGTEHGRRLRQPEVTSQLACGAGGWMLERQGGRFVVAVLVLLFIRGLSLPARSLYSTTPAAARQPTKYVPYSRLRQQPHCHIRRPYIQTVVALCYQRVVSGSEPINR